MVSMWTWVLDLGLAVVMSGLEVAALVAFWFVGSMRIWAAQGMPVPPRTGRVFLVLGVGVTSSALIGYGLARIDLPVACASQAVLAVLLTLLLVMGATTECSRWISGYRLRCRLRRERRRFREMQRG